MGSLLTTLTTIDTLNALTELLAAVGWLLLEWVAQLLLLNEASLVVGDERVVVIVKAGVISTKGEVQDARDDVKLALGQLGEGHVIQLGTSEVFKAQDLPVVAPVKGLVAHQTEDLLPGLRRHPHDLIGGRLANDGNVPLRYRPVSTNSSQEEGPMAMGKKGTLENSPRERPGQHRAWEPGCTCASSRRQSEAC